MQKHAAEDGDQSFEARFADLARQTLQDKSPLATEHELGFQLLDRADDGDGGERACGVFGLRLGDQVAYVPVFFVNGEASADLLVHEEPELFLPLSDDWIQSSLRKTVGTIGHGVDRAKARYGLTRPDLRTIIDPYYKHAAERVKPALLPAVSRMAGAVKAGAAAGDRPPDFPAAVRALGPAGFRAFAKVAYHYPVFAAAVDKVYGAGTVNALAAEGAAATRRPKAASIADILNGTPAAQPQLPPEAAPPPHQAVADVPSPLPAEVPPPEAAVADPVSAPPAGNPVNPPAPGSNDIASQFHDWAGRNLAFIPPEFPGGRGGALVAGLGAGAIGGYGLHHLAGRRHEGDPDDREMDAELAVKEAAYAARGEPGPLEELVAKPRRPRKLRLPEPGELTVRTRTSLGAEKAAGRTPPDDALAAVRAGGYQVVDDRREAATALEVRPDETFRLKTVGESGMYDVFTATGEFVRAVVLVGGVRTPRAAPGTCVVFTPSGDKAAVARTTDVWVKDGQDKDPGRELAEWVWGKETPRSLPSVSGRVVWVAASGASVAPARVWGDEDETYCFDGPDKRSKTPGPDDHGCSCKVRLTGLPGKRAEVVEGELWIPDGYRPVKLPADDNLELAGPDRVRRAIYEKSAALELRYDGRRVSVNGAWAEPDRAVLDLVVGWDLRPKQARELVDAAVRDRRVERRVVPPDWIVKLAAVKAAYGAAFAPPFPERQYGTEPTRFGAISTLNPERHDLRADVQGVPYPPYQDYSPVDGQMTGGAVGAAAGAADAGQKDVFDTAALGAMLNEADPTAEVERGLGDLMKGVDRLGRDLFFAKWDRDAFEKRYGKRDAPAIEDMLRTSHEQMGDLVLKLRQKQVGIGGVQ